MQTCIVIDEFAVVRKVAIRILKLSGYEAKAFETLDEGLDELERSGPVDIVIVSATLPGQPVDEAIRLLKSHPSASKAVILASLVEAHLGVMTRAKRAGAKGFTFRPFNRASLSQALQTYQPDAQPLGETA